MAATPSTGAAAAPAAPARLDWQRRRHVRTLALIAAACVLWYAATHAFLLLAQLGPYASDPSFATDVYIDYVRDGCFIVFGLAALGVGTLTLAAALSRTVSAAGRSRTGLYLLCVAGVCDLFAAVCSDDPPGSPLSAGGTFHTVATLAAMLCVAVAPLLFARGFRRDTRWRGYAGVSFALGALALAALVVALVALGIPALATSLGVFSPAAAPFAALTLLWLLLTALHLRRAIPA